ncbi:MAG: hypothetical protein ACHQ5A_05595 [Opitutales bacterium]
MGEQPAGRWALLAGLLLLSLTAGRASQRWETLEAIHMVENPSDTTRAGRFGELGAYQFREMTWRMHTPEPFSHALDRQRSDDIAVRHYDWLQRGLERAGLPGTAYNIALAWNGGLQNVVRGRANAAAHDYADRVSNLAAELGHSALTKN